jgi:putative endonuclease
MVTAMTKARQAIGAYGERLASRHLEDQGLVVLARNWRCADGEIDLILADGKDVVFCEVKTRRSSVFGSPAEAVGPAKVRRLRRLAARWLAEKRMGCARRALRRGRGPAAATRSRADRAPPRGVLRPR